MILGTIIAIVSNVHRLSIHAEYRPTYTAIRPQDRSVLPRPIESAIVH